MEDYRESYTHQRPEPGTKSPIKRSGGKKITQKPYIEIFYDCEFAKEKYKDEVDTQLISEIKYLFSKSIVPQIDWEIFVDDFGFFRILKIQYGSNYWQFTFSLEQEFAT